MDFNDFWIFFMIALGIDFGSILAPFCLPKSDQIGPKSAPKSIKKVIEKLVEFGIDFWTISGHFWAQMEVVFRGGQISKITKIRALGSKCDLSLQDGFPGTQNTQKSGKNEGRYYIFFREKVISATC